MPGGIQPTRLYGNRYAESICRHCGGLIRHERWCQVRNPQVAYAYQVLADPSRLSLRDQLILHALGVSWFSPGYDHTLKR
jgi:hypothetical protein